MVFQANLGVKNGHLAVIDLGETYGGTIKGKEITLTLENIKVPDQTEKTSKEEKITKADFKDKTKISQANIFIF